MKNRIGALIHVHGTVEKDMIMGVDNETQLANAAIFDGVGPYTNQISLKLKTIE